GPGRLGGCRPPARERTVARGRGRRGPHAGRDPRRGPARRRDQNRPSAVTLTELGEMSGTTAMVGVLRGAVYHRTTPAPATTRPTVPTTVATLPSVRAR